MARHKHGPRSQSHALAPESDNLRSASRCQPTCPRTVVANPSLSSGTARNLQLRTEAPTGGFRLCAGWAGSCANKAGRRGATLQLSSDDDDETCRRMGSRAATARSRSSPG